jgi:hypothetical protein
MSKEKIISSHDYDISWWLHKIHGTLNWIVFLLILILVFK